MAGNPKLLYVTDLHYPAKARVYRDEDIYITSQLAADFDIAVCHPLAAENLVDAFDIVVFRNTGPVLHYRDAYASFVRHALQSETTVYNTLTGKADMVGKQYLVELSRDGHPVIPTIDNRDEFARLPDADSYVVKPKLGSDSIGMEFVMKADLDNVVLDDMLIQPRIDFQHEVSFYFIDHDYHYAMSARPGERWNLEPFEASEADLAFAGRFIEWNDIDHGIQRVDACRTAAGELLLMELEDLNPYLSLDLVDEPVRAKFIAALKTSLRTLLGI